MEKWKGRVAVVTGGTSGIGRELVKLLVENGMKVATCGRRQEALLSLATDLADYKVIADVCDLRDEGQIKAFFKSVCDQWGGVDVCVNCAGIALDSNIVDGNPEDWKTMLDVNVMAMCLCSQEAFQSMKQRDVDDGHIININSLSGHRVGKLHFYSVCKFATQAITDSLRWEMRNIGSNIRVSEVSPGLVRTNFHEVAYGSQEKAEEVYANGAPLEARDIADIVVYLLSTPPHVQIHDVLVRHTRQIP